MKMKRDKNEKREERRERQRERQRETDREKRRKGEREKRKMKMKRKIHPNFPNELIAEYSYIFAPLFEVIRDTVTCCTFLN